MRVDQITVSWVKSLDATDPVQELWRYEADVIDANGDKMNFAVTRAVPHKESQTSKEIMNWAEDELKRKAYLCVATERPQRFVKTSAGGGYVWSSHDRRTFHGN